jgi:hypothetical protein
VFLVRPSYLAQTVRPIRGVPSELEDCVAGHFSLGGTEQHRIGKSAQYSPLRLSMNNRKLIRASSDRRQDRFDRAQEL